MDFKNVPAYKPVVSMLASAKLPNTSEKLHKVIAELDVEKSPRYKRTPDGRTWCNIFVSDVLDAFGYYPSHWMDSQGGPPEEKGVVVELNANQMLRWLLAHGGNYGWIHADRDMAMSAAERGHIVLVGWDSRTGKPGHIAVLLPEGTIAQAGRTNFVGKTIREGFGTLPVQFWVQMRGGTHQP